MSSLNLVFLKKFKKTQKNHHLTNSLSKIKSNNYQNLSSNLKSQKLNVKTFLILFFAMNTLKGLA
jgi:hypothetical protein